MKIVGERIKARRKELRMSQRDLSSRMGYSNHSTIARIESGSVDLPLTRVEQFAEVLGVAPSHLMGWDAPPEDLGAMAARVLTNPDLLKLVQNYLSMSESDQYALRLMAESLVAKEQKKTDAETSAEKSVIEVE